MRTRAFLLSIFVCLGVLGSLIQAPALKAATLPKVATPRSAVVPATNIPAVVPPIVAIPSATKSAEASASAVVEEKIRQNVARNITEATSQEKSRLAKYLDEHPVLPLRPWNMLQHAIHNAVNKGVPANTLVLLLLFPVTASLIAIFRHVIGLRGFGVYTPAVLAVALLSTGLVVGLTLFAVVFTTTFLGRAFLLKLKLQYLPRTALLLWMVCLVMFGLLLGAPTLALSDILAVGIFPILVLVLLSENFMDAQLQGNIRLAIQLTLETLFLAVVSAVFMRTLSVQEFVITHPEFTIGVVFAVDIAIGKYTGLRVIELLRFKPIVDPEE